MRKTKRGQLPVVPQGRQQRGNMIALVGAICGGLLLALLLFALAYTRLLGGNQEQKTAIEAASLAAAKDLGRIVMKDNHFGWVSLSDYGPTGKMTQAPDGNFQPVYSINTILATIRLDMILGDQVSAVCGNPTSMSTWKYLADQDFNAAMNSKNNLTALLQSSLLPGGNPDAKDLQGNKVEPYQSAETAYKQNDIRQSNSAYVNGSLKLTLGCLDGGSETTVKVPQPQSKASLGGAATQNGKYLSYVNYPYNGKNFVFTGAGTSIKLVDAKKFKATLPLPYAIPSIVMAEADQKLFENGNTAKPKGIVHILSCAQPACVPDPRPAPGLLTVDGPDNNWPGVIAQINDLLMQTQMLNNINPASIVSAQGGDYNGPGTGTLASDSGLGSSSLPPANAIAGAIYDWVRRGGNNVNIDSVVAFVNGSGLPGGKFNKNTLYKFVIDQNGMILCNTTGAQKEPYLALSENQLYMDCGDALDEIDATSGNKKSPWALYMKDQVRDWGDVLGGQHAGQPIPVNGTYIACNPADKWIACLPSALPDSAIAMNGNSGTAKLGDFGAMGTGANHKNGGGTATTSLPVHNLDDFAEPGVIGLNFPAPTGGTMPPQYLQNGVAVNIRFRVEEITTAGGGWSWGSAGLTEGHFKK